MHVQIDYEVTGSVGFRFLMTSMGWDEAKALGSLALLWLRSQQLGMRDVSEEDLGIFIGIEGDELIKFIKVCIRWGWLYEAEGKLVIRGNDKHLKLIKSYKERARKMNVKRAERLLGSNKHSD